MNQKISTVSFKSLLANLIVFTRLGLTSFGGPIAHFLYGDLQADI